MATTQTDRLSGLIGDFAFKTPVRVATTAAISLSGEQTIDGIAVLQNTAPTPPDRVLVKDQADQTLNGIYDVATGAWARSKDFDGARDTRKGTLVYIVSGSTNGSHIFKCTSSEPILIDGGSNITFVDASITGPAGPTGATGATGPTGATGATGVGGFRNWLLNGAMAVWQRGAGGSASIAVAASTTAYTADRWYLSTLANQASVVSQQAITTLPGTRYAARVQRNSGQTGVGVMVLAQPLDADTIAALVGQTCVLSAKVSTGADWSPASGTLSYKVYCGTGSVGKRNASAYTTETAPISGSTNIAAGSAVAAITAASGAIPAGTTQAEIQFFWTPVGTASTNDWFQISNIQLEVGSVASAFDAIRQSFLTELAQCWRFYDKTFNYADAPAQNIAAGAFRWNAIRATTGSQNSNSIFFKVRMRAAPTIVFFNPQAASAQARDITATGDCTGTTTSVVTEDSMVITAAGNAGTAIGNTIFVNFTAEAEL